MEYLFLTTHKSQHLEIANRLRSDHGYLPIIWIGPSYFGSDVAGLFPDCEFFAKESLLEMESSGEQADILTIRHLSEYWQSSEFMENRVNLLEEFNRYPRLENLRTVDREVLLRHIQIQSLRAIRSHKPKFLLALDVPHNPVNLTIFLLAKWLGLPTLFFDSPGIMAPCMIPKTELDQVFRFQSTVLSNGENHIQEAYSFNRGLAMANLNRIQSDSETHWQAFEADKVREHVPRRFNWINDIRSRFSREFLRFRDPDSALLADFLDNRYGALVDAHQSLSVEESAPSHGLFALQFQPESTAVPKGMVDTFQAQAVVLAREILDQNLPLVVKEHPSQLRTSMEGSFARSPYLYDWLGNLPGVQMTSGFTSSRALLGSSKIVFTLVGSIGLEAAFRGVPVVYFGAPWWAGLPGSFHYRDPGLKQKIRNYRPPDLEELKTFILDLIQDASIPGIADSGGVDSWAKRIFVPENFEAAFLDCLSYTVREFTKARVAAK